jgi:hypothetical protein
LKKKKDVARKCELLFRQVSFVDWMMEKPSKLLYRVYEVKGAVNCNCEKVGRSGQRR